MNVSIRTDNVPYNKYVQSKPYIVECLEKDISNRILDRDLDRFQTVLGPVVQNDVVSEHDQVSDPVSDLFDSIAPSSTRSSPSSSGSSMSSTLPTLHPLHTLHPSPSKSPSSPLSPSSPSSSSLLSLTLSPSPPTPTLSLSPTLSSPPIVETVTVENVAREEEQKCDSMIIGLRDSVVLPSSDADTTRSIVSIDGYNDKQITPLASGLISSSPVSLPLSSPPLLSLPPPSLPLPLSIPSTTPSSSSHPNKNQTKISTYTILHKSTDITPLQ